VVLGMSPLFLYSSKITEHSVMAMTAQAARENRGPPFRVHTKTNILGIILAKRRFKMSRRFPVLYFTSLFYKFSIPLPYVKY